MAWKCTPLALVYFLGCLKAAVSAQHLVSVPEAHSPLQDPLSLHSDKGELHATLRLGATRLVGPGIDLVTRSYDGLAPGKTLRIWPGDSISLSVVNDLEGPMGLDATNMFHHPNSTNIHLHGLHVSPLAPADDVLYTVVRPQSSQHYEYQIIPDHSPGTYWYHPHHHGSVMLQAGGGAAGAIIVQDPPSFLSSQLEVIADRVVMVQDLTASKLKLGAQASKDELFEMDQWNLGDEVLLVNGAPQPVLRMRPGEWQRLRLIMAGLSKYLNLGFGSCEAAVLAKDGIYIRDFPRFVPRVSLPPGGRADVVIRCPAGPAGEALEHSITSFARPAPLGVSTFVGKVLTLRVEGPPMEGLASVKLQPWAPAERPAYLRDTRVSKPTCSCSTSMGLGGNGKWVEGHLYGGPTAYMHRSPRDAVVERHLSGINKHPYHQHSWAFQLQETPAGDDPYFRAGDWHDTYLNVMDSEARIRFQTTDFHGPLVVHCHDLSHSDKGMLAVELVAGEGSENCGCDLLSQSELLSRTAAQVASRKPDSFDTLLITSLAGLAAMLGLMVVGSAWLARTWHSNEGTPYLALTEDGSRC